MATPDASTIREIDRVGDEQGFVARGVLKRESGRKEVEHTTPLNMRAPFRVFNPFVRFCKQRRLSYWEGLELLMKTAEVDDNGASPRC